MAQDESPKTWGEMTDTEKGALLLAHHQGKLIESTCEVLGWRWSRAPSPAWSDDSLYRIRPESKRETVTMTTYYSEVFGYWIVGEMNCEKDTHRITFGTIDGKPDCDSIKMEEI